MQLKQFIALVLESTQSTLTMMEMKMALRAKPMRWRNYLGSALGGGERGRMSKGTKAGRSRRAALARQYKALRKMGHKRAYSSAADKARYYELGVGR